MGKEPHIEFMGIFDADGEPIPRERIPRPALCRSCGKDGAVSGMEEVLCLLARCDHMLEGEDDLFVCSGFAPRD